MAPSLELAVAPVALELDEVGFVGEEDIFATGGAVKEGGGFGDVVAPGTDGLRMIRALGGIVMA